jgi:predicted DNA-binding antitoxin AbrB/MazE fold protein
MSQVIRAIYENGVFKPLQDVSVRDHEKVTLKVVPLDDWQARFAAVIARLRARTAVASPEEIEEDIRLALAESREEGSGR